MVNGKPVGHLKHVAIRDGQGIKMCIAFENGRRKTVKQALTKKELAAIQKNEYLPALFSSPMKMLRGPQQQPQPLRFSKTKKNRQRK
jgi:hypothetical protein